MSDTAYAVESFELLDDGQAQKQLTIEGWFHARVGTRGMQLAIPDGPVMIEDFRRQSSGLISMFGDTGRNCRFRLQLRIDPAIEPKLPGTRLLVLLENNDGMTIDVSQNLTARRAEPSPVFSEAEQALVMRFEGLGDNCEFGLMQRQVGRERLSLLRYSGSRETWRLVDAIRNDFEGFGAPEDLWINTFHSEWIATSSRYGFNFHTGEHVDAMTEAQIREAESTKLTFMAQMLVEDMQTCSKAFVRRVADDRPTEGMDDLYDALRSKGPATLLWVTPAEDGKPHGTVEHVRERLFRGYHAYFAPYSTAIDYDPAAWVVLLRAAEAAFAAHGQDGRSLEAIAPPALAPREPATEQAEIEETGTEEANTEQAKTEGAGASEAGGPEPAETESWRVLTGAEAPAAGALRQAPSELEPEEEGGFLGRLFGARKRQDNA